MTQIGEGVSVAIPASERHDELEVQITAIEDAKGTSIKDGANQFDPRRNAVAGGKTSSIRLTTKHQTALVSLSIKPQSGSKPAHRFYGGKPVFRSVDLFEPGNHVINWDGRAASSSRRLVIEGDYDVIVHGHCLACGKVFEQKATIKVRKPWAHCYGGVYGGAGALVGSPLHGDYTARAASADKWLKNLADGSGFDSSVSTGAAASAALVKMREESAVWFWGGHGGPGIISMPTAAGMTALVSKASVAPAYSGIVAAANCTAVSTLPSNALDDVFLVVLCGCQTSKAPSGARSLPVALIAKGVDIVIGFHLSIYTISANKWTDDFFHFLNLGVGVEEAVRKAVKLAATPQFKQRLKTFRIYVGFGVSKTAKLSPARYGRKKR